MSSYASARSRQAFKMILEYRLQHAESILDQLNYNWCRTSFEDLNFEWTSLCVYMASNLTVAYRTAIAMCDLALTHYEFERLKESWLRPYSIHINWLPNPTRITVPGCAHL